MAVAAIWLLLYKHRVPQRPHAGRHTLVYAHYQRLDSEEVLELRREGGRYLKELRDAQGLSQRQLAALVGAEYYTFISQLETGRGRIPPDRYRAWADALKIEPENSSGT
jgi:DNA-binding XRE family transcriptional regulator